MRNIFSACVAVSVSTVSALGCGSLPPSVDGTAPVASLRVSPCFGGNWRMAATLAGPDGNPSGDWGQMTITVDANDGSLHAYGMCPDGSGAVEAKGQAYTAGGAGDIRCQLPRHEMEPLAITFRHAGFIYTPPGVLDVRMVGTMVASGRTVEVVATLAGRPAEPTSVGCR